MLHSLGFLSINTSPPLLCLPILFLSGPVLIQFTFLFSFFSFLYYRRSCSFSSWCRSPFSFQQWIPDINQPIFRSRAAATSTLVLTNPTSTPTTVETFRAKHHEQTHGCRRLEAYTPRTRRPASRASDPTSSNAIIRDQSMPMVTQKT